MFVIYSTAFPWSFCSPACFRSRRRYHGLFILSLCSIFSEYARAVFPPLRSEVPPRWPLTINHRRKRYKTWRVKRAVAVAPSTIMSPSVKQLVDLYRSRDHSDLLVSAHRGYRWSGVPENVSGGRGLTEVGSTIGRARCSGGPDVDRGRPSRDV